MGHLSQRDRRLIRPKHDEAASSATRACLVEVAPLTRAIHHAIIMLPRSFFAPTTLVGLVITVVSFECCQAGHFALWQYTR